MPYRMLRYNNLSLRPEAALAAGVKPKVRVSGAATILVRDVSI